MRLFMDAMARSIDIGLIQARRRKIAEALEQERVRHEKVVAGLQTELEELTIAERVFVKLSSEGNAASQQETPVGKPEGLPAVSEMIKEALSHHLKLGSPGLAPAGMLSYIRGKWWPEATSNDVGPVAWRMEQNGSLERLETGEYALPEKAERPTVTDRIS